MPSLIEPITLRGVTLRNRIAIPPMCQYTAEDGIANAWHMVQYGRFAVGGAGLVIIEASAVSPEGRITHGDVGIWSDAHAATALLGGPAYESWPKQHGWWLNVRQKGLEKLGPWKAA